MKIYLRSYKFTVGKVVTRKHPVNGRKQTGVEVLVVSDPPRVPEPPALKMFPGDVLLVNYDVRFSLKVLVQLVWHWITKSPMRVGSIES